MSRERLGRLRSSFLVMAVASLTVPLAASELPAKFPPELDAYIEKARTEHNVPGLAIAIVKDGEVVVTKGYGIRERGRPERVDENTIFNVASLTKSFTAAGAALLVGEGKLGWDDKVQRWLPGFQLHDPWLTSETTLRDLLAHRTGLENSSASWFLSHVSRAEVIRRMRYLKQQAPFRTQLVYSNIGYTAAGEVTARAAGMSWEDLITKRLLQPLGMNHSSIAILDPRDGNISSAHVTIEGRQVPITWAWDLNTGPAGGLNSTAVDMAKWMRFQLAGWELGGTRVVAAEALRETHEPQIVVPTTPSFRSGRGVEHFAAYGMGWQVMDYRGHAARWHSGSAAGMPVYMTLLPKERLGVLVMLNAGDVGPLHGALAGRIIDVFLNLPITSDASADLRKRNEENLKTSRAAREQLEATRVTGTTPTLSIDSYAGVYQSDLYGDLLVARNGDALTLQFGEKGEIVDLSHWHHNTWRVVWRVPFLQYGYGGGTFATFTIDDTPSASAVQVRIGRELIEAKRP